MKKLLFLIPTLDGGGAEKVLVNMINNIDSSQFDISLFSLVDGGINKKFLPDYVKYSFLFKYNIKGYRHLLKLFTSSFLYKKIIHNHYDCIISFLEGPTTRIISGCNDNTRLISWIHTDDKRSFEIAFRNKKEMMTAYNRIDNIICVSNDVLNSFNEFTNEEYKNKTLFMKNVNNPYSIIKQSEEEIDLKKDSFRICVIGNLNKNKDFGRLIPMISKLNKKNIKTELLILGVGEQKENIQNLIIKYNTKNIKLLGYQENPYKYLGKSDLYICCSHYEGYSTTTIESLILNIPILTTKVSGMKEILNNGQFGFIVDDNDEEIYNKLEYLIKNKEELIKIKKAQLSEIKRLKLEFKKNIQKIENLFLEER